MVRQPHGRSQPARLDGAAVEDLVFGAPEDDPRRNAARLGGFLYIVSGLVVLVTMWLPQPPGISRPTLLGLSAAALASGLVVNRIHWERHHPRLQLSFVVLALVLIGIGNLALDGQLNPYHSMYVVTFAFVGLTQPAGTAYWLLPVAAASFAVPGIVAGRTGITLTGLAIAAPVWVVMAEVLARQTRSLRRAEQGAERLLAASRTLSRAASEDEVAHVLARLAAELLQARSTAVFLPGEGGALLNRGQHDFALTPREVILEVSQGTWAQEKAFLEGLPLVVPDAADSALVPAMLRDGLGSASVAFLPLLGEEGFLGVVAVGWEQRRTRLDRFGRRAAELLCSEAARALDRLRIATRLAIDAETDELTGLPNRRTYDRALQRIAPGDAVVVVDLDRFKGVNDRHGHLVGDEVLRSLARCMRHIARKSDTVARYGGEEFTMVLAGAGERGALAALRRLKQMWEATDPLTTFSGGVAVHGEGDFPVATLMRADTALYRAKANGRDRFEVAEPTHPGVAKLGAPQPEAAPEREPS